VLSFAGSPQTFSYKGGTVSLSAKLKLAKTCKLTVSPSLAGLPSTVSCGSQVFSKKVVLPKDSTGTPITYTFSLGVSGSGGSVTAPNSVVATVGAEPPQVTFTPSSLVFPPEGIGIASIPRTITVTNNGTSTQTLGSIAIAPITGTDTGDFQVTNGNCASAQITPRQNCTFTVTFDPTGSGARAVEVQLLDASWGVSGTLAYMSVRGTGEFAKVSPSAAAVNFGVQGVNSTSNVKTLQITNVGSAILSIGAIFIQSANVADFVVYGGNCESTLITPAKSCTFSLSFTPTGEGLRTSDVVIDDNTAGSATIIPLSGTGEFASTKLSETNVEFGSVTVGTQISTFVTITNTSSVTLHFLSSSFGGINPEDYSWTPGACGSSGYQLQAGQHCSFAVNVDAELPGSRTATLSIYVNTKQGFDELYLFATGTT